MRMTRLSLIMLLASVVGLQLLSVSASAQEKGRHPRLVSVEGARCETCHQALFQGRDNVHDPAATDCTMCHEVEIDETGTRVGLMEQEPALCLLCHDDLQRAADFEVETPHAPIGDSCVACHEPHAAEREKLLVASKPELCGLCHDAADLQASHSGQITGRVDCTSCHNPHGTDTPHMLAGSHLHSPFGEGGCDVCHREPFAGRVRLVARGEELCTSCHGDLEEPPPEGGSRHAALDGSGRRGGCLSCHDPHMSDIRKLLHEGSPGLCADCHGSVVSNAQAETGHPPAAEDCTSCHVPHSGEHPRLLQAAPEELCGWCHDASDPDLAASHLGADLAALTCTSCHSPHGAGHERLLASHVHPVIEDGCDLCHTGGAGELLEDGESPLCMACHDDIATAASEASVPHLALEVMRCADCHNPHASPQRKLLKQPAGGDCLQCHSDREAGEGETLHGAIVAIGCEACHEPHGGERPALLREEGAALCLSCHDGSRPAVDGEGDEVLLAGRFAVAASAVPNLGALRLSADGTRGHPVPNHPVSGTVAPDPHRRRPITFEGELDCLTCHDPHKGREQLMREGRSVGEACLVCHPK